MGAMLDDDFRDHVATLLDSNPVPLPPKRQKIGTVTAVWLQAEPGVAVIQTMGGTLEERATAEWKLREELRLHGYRQASFLLDGSEELRKTSTWNDIMEKAKRLVQSGNVTVLRNGYNNVVGHVIGDHGEYMTEISREDPQSRAITQWQCECPWDQYAWGRTMQWKKYEGRPCAHVMALYWKALSTPLDQDAQGPAGPGQRGPNQAPGQMGLPGATPTPPPPPGQQQTFNPDGTSMPGAGGQGQLLAPPPSQAGPTALPQGPQGAPMPPPSPAVIPPFPGEQMQQMQMWQPGTTPSGQQSPPWAMTLPGAKPQTPFNPLQYPGGTYSRTAAFQNGQRVVLQEDEYGQATPMSEEYGQTLDPSASGGWQLVPKGTPGEVLAQDETTGWIECIFDVSRTGPRKPYHVKCFLEPRQVKAVQGGTPFIRRR